MAERLMHNNVITDIMGEVIITTYSPQHVRELVDTVVEEYGEKITNGEPQERKKKKKDESVLPDITEVEKEVLKSIIGQDKQVRQILTSIYRGKLFKNIKTNALIIGSSGSGKTETIRQIAKQLNVPYTIEDATKYTQEGYVGASVEEMLLSLLKNAGYNEELAERGILVIDEIDKKKSNNISGDVAGVEVLNSLLKIVEGTVIPLDFAYDEIDFDTKNLTVIFLGAFSGLDKIRDKRLNKHPLGFSVSNESVNAKEKGFLKKDLIEYGMPEEFVGRIDTIVEMNKLTQKDLALILKKSKLSIFTRYESELKRRGITLRYSKKLFELIAHESMELDTGARELSNNVNYIFEKITYEVLSNPGKFKECRLSTGIVKDNSKYKLL